MWVRKEWALAYAGAREGEGRFETCPYRDRVGERGRGGEGVRGTRGLVYLFEFAFNGVGVGVVGGCATGLLGVAGAAGLAKLL